MPQGVNSVPRKQRRKSRTFLGSGISTLVPELPQLEQAAGSRAMLIITQDAPGTPVSSSLFCALLSKRSWLSAVFTAQSEARAQGTASICRTSRESEKLSLS